VFPVIPLILGKLPLVVHGYFLSLNSRPKTGIQEHRQSQDNQQDGNYPYQPLETAFNQFAPVVG
jgi:hypothetical protein